VWPLLAAALLAAHASPAAAVRWPWNRDAPWPDTSTRAVRPLEHATLADRAEERRDAGLPDAPVRFAAFGDQRALADGEWQSLVAALAGLDAREPVDWIVDTGDVVTDGRHTDQFAFLTDLLAPIRHRPYLVAIGNHELHNNRTPAARENAARFLAPLDPAISARRFWFRKDFGPVVMLFLDTNDLVYGDDGERRACPPSLAPTSRAAAQLAWLSDQLAQLAAAPPPLLVVVMHHPLVQSSRKHREAAVSLWNFRAGGRSIADRLLDGGVDLVLTGHTHTFERFRLGRDDGATMQLVNLSGRPRDAVLWFGAGSRRARDLRGHEREALEDAGWEDLDGWTIVQEDVMLRDEEADQFGLFTAGADGALTLEMFFLDEDAPGGVRREPPVRLRG